MNYNSFKLSQYQTKEHLPENERNSLYIDKLHIGQTSTPYFNINSDDSSWDKVGLKSATIEEDCRVLKNSTMSRARRLTRSNLHALSGDEEDDVPLPDSQIITRRRTRNINNINSVSSSSTSQSVVNNRNSNHASSYHMASGSDYRVPHYSIDTPPNVLPFLSSSSPESPQVEMIADEYTFMDRVWRWRWVRYVYLGLLSSISFDAWLLSRIHDKKYKILLLILLLLLAYLIYHTIDRDLISSAFSTVSSILSSIVYGTNLIQSDEAPNTCPAFSSFMSRMSSYLTNLFVQPEESVTFSSQKSECPYQTEQQINFGPSKEEVKSHAIEMMDERVKVLFDHFYKTKIAEENLKIKEFEISKLIEENMKFQKEISSLNVKFKEENMKCQKEISSLNVKFKTLEDSVSQVESNVKQLEGSSVKFNPSESSVLEKLIVTAFRNVVEGGENPNSPYYFIHEWLNSKLTDSTKLSSEMKVAIEKLETQLEAGKDKESLRGIEDIVKHVVEESLKANLSTMSSSETSLDFSILNMRRIAEEIIMLYDADKTGKVDFALESAGGSVLGTRCSESYTEKEGKLYLLGLPWWSDQNSPRTAIQPSVHPGECWAFKGSQGFLVIQLSYTIYPTGFTMEHIPISLSPTGSLDSAPKDFSVWGLASENDIDGTLLGNYSFDQKGGPLQYFPVQQIPDSPVSYVELKIHSNHGNFDYTCLYRIRVHGTRVK